MKAVSDAMMRYQNELTCVNVETVEAIGCMRIIGFSNESVSALGGNGNEPEMLPYRQVT